MQTLWFRAARLSSSCRCTFCLSPTTALARRATTATARRRLKVGDAFTVFYSAIFATAAVVDAKWKEDRRKDIDRKIEEVLNDVKSIKETISSRAERLSYSTGDQSLDGVDGSEDISSYRRQYQQPWANVWETAEEAEMEEKFLRSHCSGMLGGSSSACNGGNGDAVQRNTAMGGRTRMKDTALELARVELEQHIAKLVLRLLHQSTDEGVFEHKYVEFKRTTSSGFTPDEGRRAFLKEVQRRLLLLLNGQNHLAERSLGPHLYPRYAAIGSPMLRDSHHRLNDTINYLLKTCCMSGDDMETVISKICYELLVSPTPPDTDTYNLLIFYLTRLRRNDLVKIVFDAMVETKETPNEVTISSLLKFFAASSDLDSFIKLTTLLAGGGSSAGALPEAARRTDFIFGAAISGAIKLGMVEDAQRWYRDMVREGWVPNSHILTSILQCCVFSSDWTSGWQIWLKLKKLWKSSPISEHVAWRAYYWMLKLCRRCNRKDMFVDVYQEALHRGFDASQPAPKIKGLSVDKWEKLLSSESIRESNIRRETYIRKRGLAEPKTLHRRTKQGLVRYHVVGQEEQENAYQGSYPQGPSQDATGVLVEGSELTEQVVKADLYIDPSGL